MGAESRTRKRNMAPIQSPGQRTPHTSSCHPNPALTLLRVLNSGQRNSMQLGWSSPCGGCGSAGRGSHPTQTSGFSLARSQETVPGPPTHFPPHPSSWESAPPSVWRASPPPRTPAHLGLSSGPPGSARFSQSLFLCQDHMLPITAQ